MAMLFLKKYSVVNYFENVPYSPFYMASLTLHIFALLNSNRAADSSHILAATHSW
jgi:hypothetical protein